MDNNDINKKVEKSYYCSVCPFVVGKENGSLALSSYSPWQTQITYIYSHDENTIMVLIVFFGSFTHSEH